MPVQSVELVHATPRRFTPTPPTASSPPLLGRADEGRVLARLLENVRGGQSAALVIRGEAGIGKTALLAYCARHAAELRVLRIAGVEAEMELAFAALQRLCMPMLANIEQLPGPQRDALGVALGLAPGETPNRLLVALAVLGLLSAVAEERPVICIIDDAQSLDEASRQVLGCVARRLLAGSLAIVFAVTESGGGHAFEGLPELTLAGLDDEAARALLARAVPGRIDQHVLDRLIAETHGNPQALLELTGDMSSAHLAGGFELPVNRDPEGQIEEHYARRLNALPDATRRLMILAAADPAGDPALLWRAADKLGIDADAFAAAKSAELLEIGERVGFRQPLLRSVAYRAGSTSDRRRVHSALAEASDPEVDADRCAWHRALAAAGCDEQLAAELEHAACRAQLRGGLAAAATFLERATELTFDPARRAQRALGAAQARHQSGAPQTALVWLAGAHAGPLDQLGHAKAEALRAQITFTCNHGSDAPAVLLTAAQKLEPLDATLSREIYLEALVAARFAGRFARGSVADVAQAARAAAPAPTPRAPDVLLEGLAVMITEGPGPAVPLLKRALSMFRAGDLAHCGGLRCLWLATATALDVWDHATWSDLAPRHVALVRDTGALAALPLALSALACARIQEGELAAAAALVDEVQVTTEATGNRLAPYGALMLAAWRGREAELAAFVEATLDEAVPRGEGFAVSACGCMTALLHNALGHYASAADAARDALGPGGTLDPMVNLALPELVEAAARSGRADVARQALERLSARTRPAGTDWALGIEARCRALMSVDDTAERLYREAIERLGRTNVRGEHARAQLLYGEWLRRLGRRVDAREHLQTAHAMFSDMEMNAFAERARRELLATGATVRMRNVATRDELTGQERQIAGLARDGLSNPQIGVQLFLSPRTVEWHLRKVFTKLAIRSRRELTGVLPAADTDLVPA